MTFYKKVDRSAPRFRLKRQNIICQDLWEKYIKDTGNIISYKRFKEIATAINQEITKLALSERNGVLLPANLGTLQCKMFKPSSELIKETRRVEIDKSTFVPSSLDLMYGKIVWTFKLSKYKFKYKNNFFSFKGHRDFVYAASAMFKEYPERFIKVALKREKSERRKIRELENSQNNDKYKYKRVFKPY